MALVYSGQVMDNSCSSHLETHQETDFTTLSFVRVFHFGLELGKNSSKLEELPRQNSQVDQSDNVSFQPKKRPLTTDPKKSPAHIW